MNEEIQAYIDEYQEIYKKRSERRAQALELEESLDNLGVDVIQRGQRNLFEKHNIDFDEIDKANDQLSVRLAERRKEMIEPLTTIPADFEAEKASYLAMMEGPAKAQQENHCMPSPPEAIFTDIRSYGGPNSRVNVASSTPLGQVYPDLFVKGTGSGTKKTGEVECDYLWSFIPTTTARHEFNAHLEFHGRIVYAFEYHCYADTSGTGHDFNLSFGMAQPGAGVTPAVFSDVSCSLPRGTGLRYDGYRWPYKTYYLRANHRVYIHIRLTFKASARSRFASVDMNFGDPRSDNFVAMPWLCYMLPGDYH